MTRAAKPPVIAPPAFVEKRKAAASRELARHAKAIRQTVHRTRRDLIDIGRRLTEAKAICGHGNWQAWLSREFSWHENTARNYMRLHELSLKSTNIVDLKLPVTALLLIARRSTPEAVRREIIDKAECGDELTHDDIREAVAETEPEAVESEAEKPEPKPRAATPPAPAPQPTSPAELVDLINGLFGKLDQQRQIDVVVDLFKALGPHRQATCFGRLRRFGSGSGSQTPA
jgi:hypothetical protein